MNQSNVGGTTLVGLNSLLPKVGYLRQVSLDIKNLSKSEINE